MSRRIPLPKAVRLGDQVLDGQLAEIRFALEQLEAKVRALESSSGGYFDVSGWNAYNLAAGQTDLTIDREFDGIGSGARARSWVAKRAGSITGIGVSLSAAISAGQLTVKVFKNGVFTGAQLVMTAGTDSYVLFTEGAYTYVAGDVLDIRVTTNSSWSPTTSELLADFEAKSS